MDPYVDDDCLDPRIVRGEPSAEEIAQADAVVILTNHDIFDWDVVLENARYVLDTRHCVAGAQVV